MELKPLPREFYMLSAIEVAPALLGQWLVRRTPKGLAGGPIVEVEAYLENDPACHAFGGKTARNQTMWGPPGFGYVYLIYGMHCCVNAVCLPPGRAEAVLIRAIEPELNPEAMAKLRPRAHSRDLTNGPGKLCQALEITRRLDGVDLCRGESEVFIARSPDAAGFIARRGPLLATPRIGISLAVACPWRFVLPQSPFLSRKPAGACYSNMPTKKRVDFPGSAR